ncbi:hypothetical protein SERLA73DRAFT_147008 [Serpula lacrymans var. lacrymans S7.3]|uniref:protein-tyrosine-phosphatase n=2 Tax=Serpula lacrymans var. lacrymans TaxID=341189 RepID=F8QGN0_SERL3|nr:hypothetical protein SERLA73DRAFT_147008 [Serpula lacrymans var. lacrymans S7.3]
MISDTIPVIQDQLYFNTELPSDPIAADSLLLDMGMTHILSLSSAQFAMPELPSTFTHQHIDIPNQAREALLLEMPAACKFIGDAIASGGQVLVHCRVELRACIVVCAYLMSTRKIPPRQAFRVLESVLPLFIPTSNFYRHLELFAACNYNPTLNHPLVQAWIVELTFGHVSPGTTNAKATSSSSSAVRNCTVPTAPYDMATVNEALARIQTTSFVKV